MLDRRSIRSRFTANVSEVETATPRLSQASMNSAAFHLPVRGIQT